MIVETYFGQRKQLLLFSAFFKRSSGSANAQLMESHRPEQIISMHNINIKVREKVRFSPYVVMFHSNKAGMENLFEQREVLRAFPA